VVLGGFDGGGRHSGLLLTSYVALRHAGYADARGRTRRGWIPDQFCTAKLSQRPKKLFHYVYSKHASLKRLSVLLEIFFLNFCCTTCKVGISNQCVHVFPSPTVKRNIKSFHVNYFQEKTLKTLLGISWGRLNNTG
jgi:hypothetical protein